MLEVRPDKPLSPLLLALMRTLDGVATQLSIPYFVIGATARDILLEHVYGIASTRATRDIDFAVAVPSWDVFDILKTQLISTGEFIPGEAAHRLLFGKEAGAYPLDLVPFAGVERNGEIAWPPDGDFVMNIAGYADAHASALAVAIAPGFMVKIVSLPAMAVLKILAWTDRPERDKHASDVLLLLRHYHEAGQFDRLSTMAPTCLQRLTTTSNWQVPPCWAAMRNVTLRQAPASRYTMHWQTNARSTNSLRRPGVHRQRQANALRC